MYLISVPDLLQLDQWYPHQAMIEMGLVQEWTELLHGRVIFVSHEWLSWDHADPNSEQLQALQRIAGRLIHVYSGCMIVDLLTSMVVLGSQVIVLTKGHL